jgi:hypothetical protein
MITFSYQDRSIIIKRKIRCVSDFSSIQLLVIDYEIVKFHGYNIRIQSFHISQIVILEGKQKEYLTGSVKRLV